MYKKRANNGDEDLCSSEGVEACVIYRLSSDSDSVSCEGSVDAFANKQIIVYTKLFQMGDFPTGIVYGWVAAFGLFKNVRNFRYRQAVRCAVNKSTRTDRNGSTTWKEFFSSVRNST